MSYSGFIGWRYSGSRQQQQRGGLLLSFISRLSMAGLVLGVAVLIVVLSLMNGFETELRQRILGLVPHVSVYQRDGMQDWQDLAQQLNGHPQVEAVAPFVEMQGLANRKGKTHPAVVYGIDPEREATVSVIDEFIDPKTLAQLNQPGQQVIVGSALAEKLELTAGKKFRLVVPAARQGRAAKIKTLNTLAVVHTGTELDQHLLLAGLNNAAALTDKPENITGLRLALTDLDLAPQMATFLRQELGYSFYIADWSHTKGNLYHGVKMSKKLVGLILLLI
ncbi:MAG: ABC transporter permease, partial [Cellvibrionaceae bacterium]|nr:ABC transporter permease [Cellvibrionaceae bacterium]